MNKIPIRHISSNRKDPDFSENFSIRDVRTLLGGNDMVQELHRHSFFFILALEKGIGEHSIDFIPYSISDYSVFFMRPGQVHQLILKYGSTGYLIEFNNDFYSPLQNSVKQVLRKVSSKNLCLPDAGRFKKLYCILTNIFQEYSDRQERYHEVIQASLDIFFIELSRQSRTPQSLLNESSEYMQERLEEFRELMELHISTHKQVAYYAEKLHLTTYQLNAITRATLGKTCSEAINNYIILEAKRYLLATVNQINQIAWHLGYEDVSYFTRFFKKQTGYAPEAFRNKFK